MPTRINHRIVNEMRRAYRGGMTCKEMAQLADPPLHCATVADAVFGRTWRDADEPPARYHHHRSRNARLTDEQVREVRRRWRAGESQAALAAEYGYTQPGMHFIISNRNYAEVED